MRHAWQERVLDRGILCEMLQRMLAELRSSELTSPSLIQVEAHRKLQAQLPAPSVA